MGGGGVHGSRLSSSHNTSPPHLFSDPVDFLIVGTSITDGNTLLGTFVDELHSEHGSMGAEVEGGAGAASSGGGGSGGGGAGAAPSAPGGGAAGGAGSGGAGDARSRAVAAAVANAGKLKEGEVSAVAASVAQAKSDAAAKKSWFGR